MRIVSKIITSLSLASLLATLGCACATSQQVRTARQLEIVDTPTDEAAKGYVEFISFSKDAVVPIVLLDDKRHPRLLAATGVHQGDRYSFTRHQTVVAEKVRVAVSAGFHTFMIERDGEVLRVPVEEGKVTPVEINFVLVHRGTGVVVYRLTCQTLAPTPLNEKG